MRIITLTAVIILLLAHQASAQDTLQKYQRIDASYCFGGQIYNNSLVYNPGFSFQTSYGVMLNQSVGVGLGTGYTALEHEHFIPVFLEAIGYMKNKASAPLIKMQIGYSFGWYSGNMQIEGYDFNGGVYFDAGIGRKISINQTYSLLFHWSYRHQFAHMKYKVFGGQDYNEAMNYDMFVISLGLIRKCP